MAGTVPFYATQGAIQIGPAYLGSFDTSSLLPSHIPATLTTVTADVKDIAITGGEIDLASIKMFGNNEAQDIKRVGIVTCQFTIVGKDKQWMEFVFGTGTSGADGATGFTTVTGAEFVPGTSTMRSVILTFTDGTNTMFIGMFKAIPSGVDTAISADGMAMEQTITFRSLATDYYWQDNFS